MQTNSALDRAKEARVCCYDNPATMCREAWHEKHLIYSINATVLEGRDFKGGPWFPFVLNVGKWETGKIHYGDPEAIGG